MPPKGVDGLLRDKTRPSGRKPLPEKVKLKVLKKTANEPPPNTTIGVRAQWRRPSASATPACSASGPKPA